MKTYYLKIRDKFISDIKNRVKKHEYRLASPERMQAKVGDTFVLISNQNRDNFVRATIKGIKVWGFVKHGYKKSNGESVLVKDMKQYKDAETPKFNYPILKKDRNHYFLPIKAEYHTDLFPDNILKNEDKGSDGRTRRRRSEVRRAGDM